MIIKNRSTTPPPPPPAKLATIEQLVAIDRSKKLGKYIFKMDHEAADQKKKIININGAEPDDDIKVLDHPIKWEGEATAIISGHSADEIWPLLSDFGDPHLPSVKTSRITEGVNGEVGCVRHVTGSSIPTVDGAEPVSWATEKLLSMDHKTRTFSYQLIGNNIGWGFYQATIAVISPESGGGAASGCHVKWSLKMDPVEGMSQEGILSLIANAVDAVGKKIVELIN